MFLFNKKTRNIIKYIWIVLTIFIVLSMVLVYSGFSSLAGTPSASQQGTQQMDIPPEVQAQLQAQKDGQPIDMGSSPEKEAVLKAIEEGRLNIDPEAAPTEGQPAVEGEPVQVESTPPAPVLKLEI
jgi:hypothetical protein